MKLQLVQVLRALAAYLVVVYHIRAIEGVSATEMASGETPLAGWIFTNGWAGVDLFFVISGFIMVYVTFSRPSTLSSAKDFLLARIFRIYPPWWFFLGILALFFTLRYGVPYDAESVERMGNSPLNHVVSSVFLLPQPNFPILAVGWTLVHEMWFYVVFSVLLLLPRKMLWVYLLIWAMSVVAGALMGWASPVTMNFLQLAFSPLTLEFIAGGFVGMLVVRGATRFALPALVLGALSFITILALQPQTSPSAFMMEWGRVLCFTLPCCLLIYGAVGMEKHLKGKFWAVLAKLGDWSFALYLCHHFVIAGLKEAGYVVAARAEPVLGLEPGTLNFIRLGTPGYLDNALYIVGALIAPTIVAALTYYYYEQPVLKFLNSRFRKRQPDINKRELLEDTAP